MWVDFTTRFNQWEANWENCCSKYSQVYWSTIFDTQTVPFESRLLTDIDFMANKLRISWAKSQNHSTHFNVIINGERSELCQSQSKLNIILIVHAEEIITRIERYWIQMTVQIPIVTFIINKLKFTSELFSISSLNNPKIHEAVIKSRLWLEFWTIIR